MASASAPSEATSASSSMSTSSTATATPPLTTPALLFQSAGCSRLPTALDWTPHSFQPHAPEGLVAYATGNNVAIYDPHRCAVVASLRGHTGAVQAVRWVREADSGVDEEEVPDSHEADPSLSSSAASTRPLTLVSSCASMSILIWSYYPASCSYVLRARLEGHGGSVSAVAALRTADGQLLVASTAADRTILIWREKEKKQDEMRADAAQQIANNPSNEVGPGDWECIQSLQLGRHSIMACLDLTYIPLSSASASSSHSVSNTSPPGLLLLSAGGVDTRVHLYVAVAPPSSSSSNTTTDSGTSNGNEEEIDDAPTFIPAATLAGHENWIRSLQWARLDRETGGPEKQDGGAASSGSGLSKNSPSTLASLLLASASQDRRIRLWKLDVRPDTSISASQELTSTSLGSKGHLVTFAGLQLLLVLESVLSGHENWAMNARWMNVRWKEVVDEASGKHKRIRHQPLCLLSASTDKSMLVWKPSSGATSSSSSSPSSAASASGIWHHVVRVGEMGGHTLGFFGCAFSPAGDAILAHGYSGSFHLWRRNAQQSNGGHGSGSGSSHMDEFESWIPAPTASGHAGSVNDVAWDACGDYLLSTSADQTTRLWAPWKDHLIPVINLPPNDDDGNGTHPHPQPQAQAHPVVLRPSWHEISRPQLHGYDLSCLVPLPDPHGIRTHCIASGAEEKVVRIFWAPQPFIKALESIAGVQTVEKPTTKSATTVSRPLVAASVTQMQSMEGGEDDEEGGDAAASFPTAAAASATTSSSSLSPTDSVLSKADPAQLAFLEQISGGRAAKANLPELGLSNKALRVGDAEGVLRGMQAVQQVVQHVDQGAVQAGKLHQPPPEDYLLSHTLWPEIEKLYGHGYEIVSMACNHSGSLLAAACVAKKTQHAMVRVWDTTEWSEILQLESHRATVVQMAFSPDDRLLLTASRDRHVTCFKLQVPYTKDLGKKVHVATTKVKAHARIVWSCSWAPLPPTLPPSTAAMPSDSPSNSVYFFATGSRDKTVKFFRVLQPGSSSSSSAAPSIVEDSSLPPFNAAVTSVSFAPVSSRRSSQDAQYPSKVVAPFLSLAVGLEDGRLTLWQSMKLPSSSSEGSEKMQWKLRYTFHPNVCPSGVVKRISWRWRMDPPSATVADGPSTSDTIDLAQARNSELHMAVASEDHSVRMFAIPAAMLIDAQASSS